MSSSNYCDLICRSSAAASCDNTRSIIYNIEAGSCSIANRDLTELLRVIWTGNWNWWTTSVQSGWTTSCRLTGPRRQTGGRWNLSLVRSTAGASHSSNRDLHQVSLLRDGPQHLSFVSQTLRQYIWSIDDTHGLFLKATYFLLSEAQWSRISTLMVLCDTMGVCARSRACLRIVFIVLIEKQNKTNKQKKWKK